MLHYANSLTSTNQMVSYNSILLCYTLYWSHNIISHSFVNYVRLFFLPTIFLFCSFFRFTLRSIDFTVDSFWMKSPFDLLVSKRLFTWPMDCPDFEEHNADWVTVMTSENVWWGLSHSLLIPFLVLQRQMTLLSDKPEWTPNSLLDC